MCGRFTLRAGTSELRKAAAHGKNQKQDPQIVFQEKNLVEAPRKSRAKLPELLCYRPPPLKRRDRAFCLFRDTDVVVTSWTAARISWPRCRSPEHPKGGTGLLVCEELARAIGNEPAAAIVHWWGVSEVTVFRWRKAFGIGRSDPEGSRRLIQAAAQAGGEVIKEKEFTEEEREVRRQNNLKNNLVQYLKLGYHGPRWTKKQLALLGKLPDAEVAAKIGRMNGVRIMRERRGIARLKTMI